MPELRDPTRDALRAVVVALVERHGGPGKVADRVGVDRTSIHRWMRGTVSIANLGLLAHKLDEPIVVRFGPAPDEKKEAAPPGWVERLLTGVIALEDDAEITDDARDRARAKAIAALTLGANPGRPRQGGAGGGTGTTS